VYDFQCSQLDDDLFCAMVLSVIFLSVELYFDWLVRSCFSQKIWMVTTTMVIIYPCCQ